LWQLVSTQDPSASTSRVAGITGLTHHVQLQQNYQKEIKQGNKTLRHMEGIEEEERRGK
jgi:hypothetical protein